MSSSPVFTELQPVCLTFRDRAVALLQRPVSLHSVLSLMLQFFRFIDLDRRTYYPNPYLQVDVICVVQRHFSYLSLGHLDWTATACLKNTNVHY